MGVFGRGGRCAVQGLDDEYWVPEHVREWLRSLGFTLPLEDMEPHIRAWDRWMRALGDFYDYRDTDGVGRVYEVHRRSINPATRVCPGWKSLPGLCSSPSGVAAAASGAWRERQHPRHHQVPVLAHDGREPACHLRLRGPRRVCGPDGGRRAERPSRQGGGGD